MTYSIPVPTGPVDTSFHPKMWQMICSEGSTHPDSLGERDNNNLSLKDTGKYIIRFLPPRFQKKADSLKKEVENKITHP